MLKDLVVEAETPLVWGTRDVQLHKWDELIVEKIIKYGDLFADIVLENGEILLWVPVASFSTLENRSNLQSRHNNPLVHRG
jgi:hypothetical protein